MCPLPYDISNPDFYFWDFLAERICLDTPKTIKELKDTSINEFSHIPS